MRLLLLSDRLAGKASAANIILGGEEFDQSIATIQGVTRQGEVAGRQVTLVDTQAWRDYEGLVERTLPNVLKQEVLNSIVLCSPGPHAFLLVVHQDVVFSEEMRNAVSNTLALFGSDAWDYSIVLLVTSEPMLEKKYKFTGKMLQWVVEKCNNRYHVLDSKNRGTCTQVTELLEKIEELVVGNAGRYFTIDKEILEREEKRKNSQKIKAEARMMAIKLQRSTLKASKGIPYKCFTYFN